MVRVLAFLILAALPAAAQGKAGGKVGVRFAAQVLPPGLGPLTMVAGETRSEPFELPLNNLSPRLEAPARQFALQAGERPAPVARIALPESGNDFVILLVVSDKPGFTPVVLPAADVSFKPGDVYMHNTSKATIIGMVGSTRFTLAPAKGRIVRPAGAREERFYDVAFGVRENSGNRVISTTRWPVDDRTRSYVFFFDNPARKDVDFRAIDEFVPVPTKSAG